MKRNQNFKTLLVTLGVCAVLASCTKEPFESPAQDNSQSEEMVADQPENSQDAGSTVRETGCNLLSPVEYAKLPKAPEFQSPLSLPIKFALACPPVRSQGSEGSCVAWGTAYAARSIMARKKTGGGFSYSSNIMSPEYIYNQIKIGSCGDGAYVNDALSLMSLPLGQGVCHWSMMPYSDTNGCSTMPNSTQQADALDHRILYYGTLSSITPSNIKNAVYAGYPVIVAGPVDVNFQQLGSQVYASYDASQKVGNHCYCIVGWNANKNAFKVMNSWGTNWGDNGFGWIHYSLASTLFHEAYIMVD